MSLLISNQFSLSKKNKFYSYKNNFILIPENKIGHYMPWTIPSKCFSGLQHSIISDVFSSKFTTQIHSVHNLTVSAVCEALLCFHMNSCA